MILDLAEYGELVIWDEDKEIFIKNNSINDCDKFK